jgi:sugar phosphate isomerase/epimerase
VKLGAYTACLHDKPVEDAIQILADLGLDSAEINSGGFLPPTHIPDAVLAGDRAAIDEYLGMSPTRASL